MAYYTKNGTQNYVVNLNQASSNYTPANSSGYDCTLSVVTGAIDSSYRTGSSTIYTILQDKYTITVSLTGTYTHEYFGTLTVTNSTHSSESWSTTVTGDTTSWTFTAHYGDVLTMPSYISYTAGSYTFYVYPYVNNTSTTSVTVSGAITIEYRATSRSCNTCSATTTCGSSSSCSTCSAVTTCGKSSKGSSTCIYVTCRRSSGQ